MALMEVKTPRVDLSAWQDPEHHDRELEVARSAFRTWGFVEFYNHDIPEAILESAFEASEKFYALSEEEKLKCMVDGGNVGPASNFQLGYRGDIRAPDGRRRAKEHFICARYVKNGELLDETFKPENVWPQNPAHFKNSINALHQEFSRLANTLLIEVFSECLGIASNCLRGKLCAPDLVCKRFLYLHHCYKAKEGHEALGLLPGVPAHDDPGAFTIVVQANKGVDGLQVLYHAGEWTTIRPSKYSLIVNPGDCMKTWSNGSMQSMTHRVINSPEGSRFSMAYFVFPPLDMVIEPIPELITKGNPPQYKPFKLFQLTTQDPESKRLNTFKISDGSSAELTTRVPCST